MTPSQLEHLKLIDAHLERLLAIAEKRTPGEWEVDQSTTWDQARGIHPQIVQRNAYLTAEDAAFIASCAGNAEAGWRATRAAIALLFAMCDGAHSINTVIAAQKMGKSILAAFPLELIQKP